jgi:hypothetical protein
MEHLDRATRLGPTLPVGNHLSYFDASSTDALVAWSGRTDLADRIVAAAGPKVYEDLFRLVAASCLNTLPVPQSTSFAHTAKLAPRELARKGLEVAAAKDEDVVGAPHLLEARKALWPGARPHPCGSYARPRSTSAATTVRAG